MAITINGSGTVTGLAVGGLPDGTVDADTLAAGAAVPADGSITTAKLADTAVSTAKLANGAVTAVKRGPGSVLQVLRTSTAMAAYSTTSDTYSERASLTMTPTQAGSDFLIQLTCRPNTYAGDNQNALASVKFTRNVDGGGDTNIATVDEGLKIYVDTAANYITAAIIMGPPAPIWWYDEAPSYSLGDSIVFKFWFACHGGTSGLQPTDGYMLVTEVAN